MIKGEPEFKPSYRAKVVGYLGKWIEPFGPAYGYFQEYGDRGYGSVDLGEVGRQALLVVPTDFGFKSGMEETMSDDAILYEKDGPVAKVILNRPERRNALTDPMFTQIVDAYHRAEQDDDVKVIELMGNGDTFCVGFDLRDPDLFYEGADVGENNVRDGIYALRFRTEVMRDMMFVLKPTIARIHRHCIGAGLFLTLVADFAIASDDTVFGFPESRYGDAGGVWCFPFVVMQCGLKRARELLMTGRKFTAQEAERFNFINHAVPMDKLDDEVNELIHALCSLPRDSLAFAKSFQHEIYGTLGVPSFFMPHYTIHPLALQIKRKQDEFDFRETIRQKGLKGGIEERNKRFSGRYWNW